MSRLKFPLKIANFSNRPLILPISNIKDAIGFVREKRKTVFRKMMWAAKVSAIEKIQLEFTINLQCKDVSTSGER